LKFFSLANGAVEITGYPDCKADVEHLAYGFNRRHNTDQFPDLVRVHIDGSVDVMQVHWKKSYETLLAHYKAPDDGENKSRDSVPPPPLPSLYPPALSMDGSQMATPERKASSGIEVEIPVHAEQRFVPAVNIPTKVSWLQQMYLTNQNDLDFRLKRWTASRIQTKSCI
jgi:hypothetical protein